MEEENRIQSAGRMEASKVLVLQSNACAHQPAMALIIPVVCLRHHGVSKSKECGVASPLVAQRQVALQVLCVGGQKAIRVKSGCFSARVQLGTETASCHAPGTHLIVQHCLQAFPRHIPACAECMGSSAAEFGL